MIGHRIPDDDEMNAILKEYGDYLVGLAYLIRPEKGNAEADCNSGFIMEIGDRWFWTTAGHVLKLIKTRLDHGQRVLDFRMADCYGNGLDNNAIPFDYQGAWKFWNDNERSGLDFGVVELSEYYKRLLQANGVKAVTEWPEVDIDCESHFVFGLASDDIERTHEARAFGYAVKVRPLPNVVHITKCACPADHQKDHERFVGTIGDEEAVGDIDGMSGGPVFGILKGFAEHKVFAVQSAWDRRKRLVFACPLAIFGPMVETELRKRT